ncbi:unnamed protein product [Closterium sp. NIES-53]
MIASWLMPCRGSMASHGMGGSWTLASPSRRPRFPFPSPSRSLHQNCTNSPNLSSTLLSTPLHSFPLLSTPLRSSPLHSSPLLSSPLHSSLLLSSPLLSAPLLSSPLRSSPLLSSPLLPSPLLSSPRLSSRLHSSRFLSTALLLFLPFLSLLHCTHLPSTPLGFDVEALASSGREVTGLDISPAAVAHAEKVGARGMQRRWADMAWVLPQRTSLILLDEYNSPRQVGSARAASTAPIRPSPLRPSLCSHPCPPTPFHSSPAAQSLPSQPLNPLPPAQPPPFAAHPSGWRGRATGRPWRLSAPTSFTTAHHSPSTPSLTAREPRPQPLCLSPHAPLPLTPRPSASHPLAYQAPAATPAIPPLLLSFPLSCA